MFVKTFEQRLKAREAMLFVRQIMLMALVPLNPYRIDFAIEPFDLYLVCINEDGFVVPNKKREVGLEAGWSLDRLALKQHEMGAGAIRGALQKLT